MRVIWVVGPTAVGKTAFAIRLAQLINAPIISADSRQVFKELNIGVARPSNQELSLVTHYLIASRSIFDNYSAGDFANEANAILENLKNADQKFVIICGGSGLYIDALFRGLDDFGIDDKSHRDNLNNKLLESGIDLLYDELLKLDPIYAKIVDKNNPQRIIRALEVIYQTGKPFSEFHKGRNAVFRFESLFIGLNIERELLYNRINTRVLQMMESGLLEEAKNLLPFKALKALETVGYKELFSFLENQISLEIAVSAIQQNTRRYAKRQLTWFNKMPNLIWENPDKLPQDCHPLVEFISQKT